MIKPLVIISLLALVACDPTPLNPICTQHCEAHANDRIF